jgi:hypothetical protein
MTDAPACAALNRATGEPLAGTGTTGISTWLLVESMEPWPARGLPDAMPPALRGRLESARAAVAGCRLVLIRPDRPSRDSHRRVFVIRSDRDERVARSTWIPSQADPGPLQVDDLLAHGAAVTAPLVLVCTHGQRDTCCAREGMPVYRALAERAARPDQVWRSTHLGGHRFAPTALVLPAGVHYGRLEPEDAADVLHHADRDRILGHRYRGRTWASGPAQAALCHVRAAHDAWGLDAVQLSAETPDGAEVVVRLTVEGAAQSVRVRRSPMPIPIVKSCGEAPVPVSRWQVVP